MAGNPFFVVENVLKTLMEVFWRESCECNRIHVRNECGLYINNIDSLPSSWSEIALSMLKIVKLMR